jgi:hypothetical protein
MAKAPPSRIVLAQMMHFRTRLSFRSLRKLRGKLREIFLVTEFEERFLTSFAMTEADVS